MIVVKVAKQNNLFEIFLKAYILKASSRVQDNLCVTSHELIA